jgi:isoleucyl-tRNA synthetase
MDGGTVYVDVALDDELEGEGWARELVRRVQEMRRQLDLAVDDMVEVAVVLRDSRVAALVAGWHATIADEVRAVALCIGSDGEMTDAGDDPLVLVADWDLDGLAVTIRVARAE